MGRRVTGFFAALLLCVVVSACDREAAPAKPPLPAASGEAGESSAPPKDAADAGREFSIAFTPGPSLLAKSVKARGGEPPYAIYAYGGDVDVIVEGERLPLAEALENNRVTMDEILAKAAGDLENGVIEGETYKDGGSRVFRYPDYAILKFHTRSGKEDVYIGHRDISTSGFY